MKGGDKVNKKVINISKKKLTLGNVTLEPLKPVIFKEEQLTNSILKSIHIYENLGFLKVFDIQEQPLLYTQLPGYQQELEIKKQQEKVEPQQEPVSVTEEQKEVESEATKKQTKTSTSSEKKNNEKQQSEEEQEIDQ